MDQSQADSAAACQHCGQSVSVARERDNQSDASPVSQSPDNTSGSRKSNESSDEPPSKSLLVHGNSRLGHVFLGCVNGDKRQQRMVLSKFISAWTEAAKQEFGVNIVVDLDDWPREHERAEDVRKALAALEPALHTSVAIDAHKLVGMEIRLLPARYMFYIQGTVSFNLFSPDTSRYALETSKGGLSDDGVLHVRGNPVDVQRAFSHLDVEVAAERREAVMQWDSMAKQLQPALCSVLRVRFVVHDDSKYAAPSAQQMAHFCASMLQFPDFWDPLVHKPVLDIAIRVYSNDRWSRPLGMPAAALVNPRMLDVHHSCHPPKLLAALLVLHRRNEQDAQAAKQSCIIAARGEGAAARDEDMEYVSTRQQKQQSKQQQQVLAGRASDVRTAVAEAITAAPIPSTLVATVVEACRTLGPAQTPGNPQSGLGVALQSWGAVRAGPMHAVHTTRRAGTDVSWYHRVVKGPSGIWVT